MGYLYIMKHIIKKILKEESLKQSLKQEIESSGWEATAELVNGPEELAKLVFNNDPMEFLHMFDNMDVVQSESDINWTLCRYEKGHNLMVYDRKNGGVVISYSDIWSFLEDGFGLNDSEVRELITRWLDEVYEISGDPTESDFFHSIE